MNRFLTLIPLIALFAASTAEAQELRHVGPRRLGGAAYDPVRQRVVLPDIGGYSNEWDGVAWHRVPDAGSVPGICYFDAGGRLTTAVEDFWGFGDALTFHQRIGHEWQTIPTTGGPQDRWGVGFAFDGQRGELLVFGGFDGTNSTVLDETWTFDGATWTQHTPAVSPPARYFASLCYDSVRQRVVMFGGVGQPVMNDTWEWDGITWTQSITAIAPPSRAGRTMAFDSARGVAVLAGGYAGTLPPDLWEYDGTSWLQRTAPPVPAGRSTQGLVYDAARGESLLIGSVGPAAYYGDVLAWDGSQWSTRPGLGDQPVLASFANATTDWTGALVLRFGGAMNGQVSIGHALVGWDGVGWHVLATGGPPARGEAALWSMSAATYVFGGVSQTSTALSDTWRWDGVAWTQMTPAVAPSPRRDAAIAFHATQNRALLFGGSDLSANLGGLGDTWAFDGTNWQQLTIGPQPGPRRAHAMAYDPVRDRVVMYGGHRLSPFPGGSIVYDDTWEHDGTSWTQVLTGAGTAGPSPTCSMAFAADRQRIVSIEIDFNGYLLWEYDGVSWTQLAVDGDAGSAHPVVGYEPLASTGPGGRLVVTDLLGALELLPTPSSTESYGMACSASAPELLGSELPVLGQGGFALEVTRAPASSPVAIAGADQDANLPMLGCTLLVAPGVSTALLASDAMGFARQPLPLPAVSALLGVDFYFQAGVLDPAAANGFTLSRGLRVTLGQ